MAEDSPEATHSVKPCRFGSLLLFVGVGPEHFTDYIHDAFTQGTFSQFGVGWRYKRFTLVGIVQDDDALELNENFLGSTQYTSGELDMHSYAGIVDAGIQFRVSQKWKMEPFIGLQYCVVMAPDENALHPNWRLRGDSKLRPTAGARLKYRFKGKHECSTNWWAFTELRISSLKFNNDEYGSGLGIQVSFGVGGDIVVFR